MPEILDPRQVQRQHSRASVRGMVEKTIEYRRRQLPSGRSPLQALRLLWRITLRAAAQGTLAKNCSGNPEPSLLVPWGNSCRG
jgi:hypothetical protein